MGVVILVVFDGGVAVVVVVVVVCFIVCARAHVYVFCPRINTEAPQTVGVNDNTKGSLSTTLPVPHPHPHLKSVDVNVLDTKQLANPALYFSHIDFPVWIQQGLGR